VDSEFLDSMSYFQLYRKQHVRPTTQNFYPTLLKEDAIQQLLTPSNAKNGGEIYGLFWFVDGDSIFHGGDDFGTKSFIWLDRQQELGFVFITNAAPGEDKEESFKASLFQLMGRMLFVE
jgi:hypothetical protein